MEDVKQIKAEMKDINVTSRELKASQVRLNS